MDDLTGALVQELHEECAKGKESLRLEFAREDLAASGPFTIELQCETGPHAGVAFELDVGSAVCFIGRSGGKKFREHGISLPKDHECSTTHAKIEVQRGAVVLVDVGSTNGTTLDGVPLAEGAPYPLREGGSIVVGSSTFAVGTIVTPSTSAQ